MKNLVNSDGNIQYGLYDEPIAEVNYQDFQLETPMGLPLPKWYKKLQRNKFVFWGIVGADVMIGLAIVDLKYLTNGFFYTYDVKSKKIIEFKKIALPSKNVLIDSSPEFGESNFISKDLKIYCSTNSLSVQTPTVNLELSFELKPLNPLRMCTRSGYRGWAYTQKTSPIPISGTLTWNDKIIELESPDYYALRDWTLGFMRHKTFWNWASTACQLPDSRSFGLNLSCGVNETSFTENAFWIDQEMTKVDMVNFEFNAKDLYQKWTIESSDGRIKLSFQPDAHRSEKVQAFLIASNFTQLVGIFSGFVVTKENEQIKLDNVLGWAEDHYAKW